MEVGEQKDRSLAKTCLQKRGTDAQTNPEVDPHGLSWITHTGSGRTVSGTPKRKVRAFGVYTAHVTTCSLLTCQP